MFGLMDKVARLACGAVANAAENSSTHPALLSRTNAMHYMVFLMRSRHLSVHREASRACGNLLTNRDAHKDFISEVRKLCWCQISAKLYSKSAYSEVTVCPRGQRKGCRFFVREKSKP